MNEVELQKMSQQLNEMYQRVDAHLKEARAFEAVTACESLAILEHSLQQARQAVDDFREWDAERQDDEEEDEDPLYAISIESEVYGRIYFTYDSEAEALIEKKYLEANAGERYAQDGVERTITYRGAFPDYEAVSTQLGGWHWFDEITGFDW